MFYFNKKNTFSLVLIATCLILFITLPSPKSAQAQTINILDYMMSTSGNNISSGEYFWVDGGSGDFRMCKNHDCSEYQRFRSDGSYIYHVEDLTWATGLNQNVHCDSGPEAFYRVYEGAGYNCSNFPDTAGGRWAPVTMHLDQTLSTGYSIVGFNEELYRSSGELQCCDTPYSGDLQHNLTLRYHGCVVFSTGAVLDDVAILSGGQGGYSENYYYDNEYGWVGFDIGGASDGAYITDPINEVEDTSQCVQANALTGSSPGADLWGFGAVTFDWPENPAHFYIPEWGNEDLIERIREFLHISPAPIIPLPSHPEHECVSLTKNTNRNCITESDPDKEVTYTVNVTNSCLDTISGLTLEDNNTGSIAIPSELGQGESFEHAYTVTVSWTTNNRVTLTGQRPGEGGFEISASSTVRVQEDCSYCRHDNVPMYCQREVSYGCGGGMNCTTGTSAPSSWPQTVWCHVTSIAMLLAWKDGPNSNVSCPGDLASCGNSTEECGSTYNRSGTVDPRHLWEYSNSRCENTHTIWSLSNCAAPIFTGETISQTRIGNNPPDRTSYLEDLNAHLCQYGPVSVLGAGSGVTGRHWVVVTGMSDSQVFVSDPWNCSPTVMEHPSFWSWVNALLACPDCDNDYHRMNYTLKYNIWHFTTSP